MKIPRLPLSTLLCLSLATAAFAADAPSVTAPTRSDPPTAPYGANTAAGSFAKINGIKLYHEIYGTGSPLLVIHGNGGSIHDLENQIGFFASRYRVIAADSRGHGKSGLGESRLTYEQMAGDLNALLEKLGVKSVNILGCSDGGIIGLLLAIHHPDKVGKLAILGANLSPDGAYDWALEWVARENANVDAMIAKGDKSQPWLTLRQHLDLLGKQPNIPLASLAKITSPTLVMAGDRDIIRDDHTLKIFHALPHSQLAIFPGATHLILHEDPEQFNRTIERFFSLPFAQPDTRDFFR
jgi:pimeloyl-ACP methyl ester carboxylesterase